MDDYLKIGALARLSGLSERTLRYYEELGIITPARTDGRTRLYSKKDIEVAKVANNLRELDIPLETIQAIASKRRKFKTGEQSSLAMAELLETLSSDLNERASKIISLQSDLITTMRLLRSCRNCKNKPSPTGCPTCPLEINEDTPQIVSLIWQNP